MTNKQIKSNAARKGAPVLDNFIDALTWDAALKEIIDKGGKRESRSVCLCNVHSSVTAREDLQLAKALATSDMVLPDGAPVAWMLRRKGFRDQARMAGPDLMWKLCGQLQDSSIGVFLFGSSERTLGLLGNNLKREFPNLSIKGSLSPRFGDWDTHEDTEYIAAINQSGAGIIFVGLGCPKQEIWMTNNREKIQGVTLGVGAAFDFHAGTVKRAPEVFQKLGLEWLHRLLSEPSRLWKRYLVTNTKFICWAVVELTRS